MKRRHLSRRLVAAEGVEMLRPLLYAGARQDVAHPHAAPVAVAARAVSPLHAGNDRRLQHAPISRALQHAGRFGVPHLLQLGEREIQRMFDLAVDGQPPRLQIGHLRHPVAADEEEIDWRDVVGEQLERRLRVDRIAVHLDHVPLRLVRGEERGWGERRGERVAKKSAAIDGHRLRFYPRIAPISHSRYASPMSSIATTMNSGTSYGCRA